MTIPEKEYFLQPENTYLKFEKDLVFSDIRQHMESNNFEPPDTIEFNSPRWQRFGEEACCAVKTTVSLVGETPVVRCFYMSWRNEDLKFCFKKAYGELTSRQWEEFESLIEQEACQQEETREEEFLRSADIVRKTLEESFSTGESPYLKKKGVGGYGVRYSGDLLLIPMFHLASGELSLCNMQSIYRNREGDFVKRFYPQARKKGAFAVIGTFNPQGRVFLCEGYATGASLYEALSEPVICAMDAGNLLSVATAFKESFPSIEIVVCADRDESGVGQKKAKECAKVVNGSLVIPSPRASKDTDFNDIHQSEGLDVVQEQITRKLPKRLKSFGLGEFLEKPIPPREKVLSPWLEERGLVMIYARRGTGKTFFGLNVAYAIASGGEYLRWKAPKPRKVLYIDGEMPGITLQERLSCIVASSSSQIPGEEYFQLLPADLQECSIGYLDSLEGQKRIESFIGASDVIFLDNLSSLTNQSENDASAHQPLQEWLLKLRRMGKTVIFVHHAGKGGSQRGTSRREDVLDEVVLLKRPKGYTPEQGAVFEVHFEKGRGLFGEDASPLEVSPVGGEVITGWEYKFVSKATEEQVKELLATGAKDSEIQRELEISRTTLWRIKTKLKSQEI